MGILLSHFLDKTCSDSFSERQLFYKPINQKALYFFVKIQNIHILTMQTLNLTDINHINHFFVKVSRWSVLIVEAYSKVWGLAE